LQSLACSQLAPTPLPSLATVGAPAPVAHFYSNLATRLPPGRGAATPSLSEHTKDYRTRACSAVHATCICTTVPRLVSSRNKYKKRSGASAPSCRAACHAHAFSSSMSFRRLRCKHAGRSFSDRNRRCILPQMDDRRYTIRWYTFIGTCTTLLEARPARTVTSRETTPIQNGWRRKLCQPYMVRLKTQDGDSTGHKTET
jgi:hypothetical protein